MEAHSWRISIQAHSWRISMEAHSWRISMEAHNVQKGPTNSKNIKKYPKGSKNQTKIIPRIWDAGIAIESRACVINMSLWVFEGGSCGDGIKSRGRDFRAGEAPRGDSPAGGQPSHHFYQPRLSRVDPKSSRVHESGPWSAHPEVRARISMGLLSKAFHGSSRRPSKAPQGSTKQV